MKLLIRFLIFPLILCRVLLGYSEVENKRTLAKEQRLLERKDYLLMDDGSYRSFLIPREIPKNIRGVLIYFHGLQSSRFNTNSWETIAETVLEYDILPIFPLGDRGLFPNKPQMFAWGPKQFNDNLEVLDQLISYLYKTYDLTLSSPIVLAGFSNGAYFLSQVLQNSRNLPGVVGYWLQGGGGPVSQINRSPLPKVYLEVGKYDEYHFQSVQGEKRKLEKIFYKEEDKARFLYLEFDGGHEFWLNNFPVVYKFFWEE